MPSRPGRYHARAEGVLPTLSYESAQVSFGAAMSALS